MAAAGAAAAQGFLTPGGSSSQAGIGGAGLDVIKAKLEVLKQQIGVKTKNMSAEKQAKIQGQMDKLEKSLTYAEQAAGPCRTSCADQPPDAALQMRLETTSASVASFTSDGTLTGGAAGATPSSTSSAPPAGFSNNHNSLFCAARGSEGGAAAGGAAGVL